MALSRRKDEEPGPINSALDETINAFLHVREEHDRFGDDVEQRAETLGRLADRPAPPPAESKKPRKPV